MVGGFSPRTKRYTILYKQPKGLPLYVGELQKDLEYAHYLYNFFSIQWANVVLAYGQLATTTIDATGVREAELSRPQLLSV